MCCFSRPIKHVSATHIFARHVEPGRQAIVYSMNVAMDEDLAMVLPIPVVPGSAEDAVRFVNLRGYPRFFVDLHRAFPEQLLYAKSQGLLAAAASRHEKLVVHDVGAFVASFVPRPGDFERLDARFRLAPDVFLRRPEYGDFGFAVFQLKAARGWFGRIKRQTIHPMAFTFPTRRPKALFFPTLHIHDGHLPDKARFDHALYVQSDDALLVRTLGFEPSMQALGDAMNASRAMGLVDPAARAYRQTLHGERANVDHYYEPPSCRGVDVLDGRGALFRFELRATAAYSTELVDGRTRRWHDVARSRLDALHDGLHDGLRALTESKREAWSLIAPQPDLEAAWLSNDDVYAGGSAWDPVRSVPVPLVPGTARALRLPLFAWTDVVEPQMVELGFAVVPSRQIIAEIKRSIVEVVTRAVTG